MILRIKFHGLDEMTDPEHMEEVMKFCETKLQIRINEEEDRLLNPDDRNFPRSGTAKRTKSKDWKDNLEMPLDMIAFTIRAKHILFTDFNNYA